MEVRFVDNYSKRHKQSVGMKYLRTVEGCIKRDHTNNEDIREKLTYNQYKIKQTNTDKTG